MIIIPPRKIKVKINDNHVLKWAMMIAERMVIMIIINAILMGLILGDKVRQSDTVNIEIIRFIRRIV